MDSGNDKIVFAAGLLNAGRLNTIVLSGGEIDFTDPTGTTTIQGPGDMSLAVSANYTSRVFGILEGAAVSISGLTITDGSVASDPNTAAVGGGIENHGTLTLNSVIISENSVSGGAASDPADSPGGAAFGVASTAPAHSLS